MNTMKIKLVSTSKQPVRDLYFDTYSAAVQHALKQIEAQGYSYDEDDYFHIVNTGSKRPTGGSTTRWSLPLQRNGKTVREALHVQVFDRGLKTYRGNYELNFYIS